MSSFPSLSSPAPWRRRIAARSPIGVGSGPEEGRLEIESARAFRDYLRADPDVDERNDVCATSNSNALGGVGRQTLVFAPTPWTSLLRRVAALERAPHAQHRNGRLIGLYSSDEDRTPKLTCRGRRKGTVSREISVMRPRSGAASGSATARSWSVSNGRRQCHSLSRVEVENRRVPRLGRTDGVEILRQEYDFATGGTQEEHIVLTVDAPCRLDQAFALTSTAAPWGSANA